MKTLKNKMLRCVTILTIILTVGLSTANATFHTFTVKMTNVGNCDNDSDTDFGNPSFSCLFLGVKEDGSPGSFGFGNGSIAIGVGQTHTDTANIDSVTTIDHIVGQPYPIITTLTNYQIIIQDDYTAEIQFIYNGCHASGYCVTNLSICIKNSDVNRHSYGLAKFPHEPISLDQFEQITEVSPGATQCFNKRDVPCDDAPYYKLYQLDFVDDNLHYTPVGGDPNPGNSPDDPQSGTATNTITTKPPTTYDPTNDAGSILFTGTNDTQEAGNALYDVQSKAAKTLDAIQKSVSALPTNFNTSILNGVGIITNSDRYLNDQLLTKLGSLTNVNNKDITNELQQITKGINSLTNSLDGIKDGNTNIVEAINKFRLASTNEAYSSHTDITNQLGQIIEKIEGTNSGSGVLENLFNLTNDAALKYTANTYAGQSVETLNTMKSQIPGVEITEGASESSGVRVPAGSIPGGGTINFDIDIIGHSDFAAIWPIIKRISTYILIALYALRIISHINKVVGIFNQSGGQQIAALQFSILGNGGNAVGFLVYLATTIIVMAAWAALLLAGFTALNDTINWQDLWGHVSTANLTSGANVKGMWILINAFPAGLAVSALQAYITWRLTITALIVFFVSLIKLIPR